MFNTHMKVLYIHGANSHFKPDSKKVRALGRIGTVYGFSNDYSLPYEAVIANLIEQIEEVRPDIIVGTSLGGYLAAQLGNLTGTEFIAINPAIKPAEIGHIVDVPDFPDLGICFNGIPGTIFLSDDEVLDADATEKFLEPRYTVVRFRGGDHRFDQHIEEAVEYHLRNNKYYLL